jgi:hypothetical protein
MSTQQFNKDVSSFVSFALRTKPTISFPGHYDNKGNFVKEPVRIRLEDNDLLSEMELSNVEALMEKYSTLKRYLTPEGSLDKLKIVPKDFVQPKDDLKAGLQYKVVSVNAKQLEIAKTVSRKANEILDAYSNGAFRKAKKLYNSLNDYVTKTRLEFINEFVTIREVEDSLGLYGVGLNDEDNGGAVIFVIIEIFVSFAPDTVERNFRNEVLNA